MNLRRECAKMIAKAIDDACQLKQPTTIIAASPSAVTDYPTTAVWMERFQVMYDQEDEMTVDADGTLLEGALLDIAVMPAGAAMIDDVAHLSRVGTALGTGRIWVGCRLPPRREEVEDAIRDLFLQDPGAPGRMLLTIERPTVGRHTLPWPLTIACFVGNSEWTDEFAFSERLWAWLSFELEMDVFVVRKDALIENIVLGTNFKTVPIPPGSTAAEEDPVVVAVDPSTEYFVVDSDGNVSQYNP